MNETRQAFIGLGSNLGDRAGNIHRAVDLLSESKAIVTIQLSPLYESAPVGVTEQPDFLNAVAGLETALPPEDLLALLLKTEQRMGRIRRERWGPRLIDLDLLLYEGEQRDTPALTLPHPRFRERPFVTLPLLDLLRDPKFHRFPWLELVESLSSQPADPSIRRFFPENDGPK